MTGWGGRHRIGIVPGCSAQRDPECARQQRSVHTAWTVGIRPLPTWQIDTAEFEIERSLLELLDHREKIMA